MGGGGKNAAKRQANEARAAEQARQGRIREGTTAINDTFGQFGDDYFSNLRNSFTEFAVPQLDDQFSKAREELTFALARSGTLDSSIRADQSAKMQREYDLTRQNIADQALGYENKARSQIEDARSELIRTLQSTGDAQGAAQAAQARAGALAQPPTYSPLEQLFTDFSAGLAKQAALERAEAFGSPVRPRYNTGLFGPSADAVRTS